MEVNMKKILEFILIITIILSFSSCSLFFDTNTYHVHGIDEYLYDDSWNGLTQNIFPCVDFIQKFSYVNGDYHYYDNFYTNEKFLEKVFCILEYNNDIYQDAKEFCMSKMNLNKENQIEYKDHIFYVNQGLYQADFEVDDKWILDFPYYFTMFGYSDVSNTLIFIGLYCADDYYESADKINTDFDSFWVDFYGDYYSFA